MILAVLALAAVQPLHVGGMYETVEVRAGTDVLARVLCISTFGVDESAMTDEQRQRRADVLRRIDATWASQDRRGKARLMVALGKADGAAPTAMESFNECRFALPDETVVRAGSFYAASIGSSAFILEDITTGQYVSVLSLGERSTLPALFRELYGEAFEKKLDEATKDDLKKRIQEEDARVAAKTRAVAEVNGQRDFLPRGAGKDDVGKALAAMWGNLDGEARERISRCLAMFALAERLMADSDNDPDWNATSIDVLRPDVAWKYLALPTLPPGTRICLLQPYSSSLPLKPLPEESLKPFYGERGWSPPDFSLSFPAQVRRLLRGDRD